MASNQHGDEGKLNDPGLFERMGPEEIALERNTVMKQSVMISLGLALGLAPLTGASETVTTPEAPPPPRLALPDSSPQLSPSARGVLKMVDAGVPEEVVKAYIENNPSAFNLKPEEIGQLQVSGVSRRLTTAMLDHDKELGDGGNASPSPSETPDEPPPPTTPVAPYAGPDATQAVSDYEIFDNVAPYGEWDNVAGYGWCWRPYSWLGPDYYPWGWLGYGSWCNFRSRGWCWVPYSHFRNSRISQHVVELRAHPVSFAHNQFASRGIGSGQFHLRTTSQPVRVGSSTAMNHRAVGVRTVNPGVSRVGASHGLHTGASGGLRNGAGVGSQHATRSGFGHGASAGFHGAGGVHGGSGGFHGSGGGFHGGGSAGFHGGGGGHR